jgi:hypothetical protein
VILVRGKSSLVQGLANALFATKGVKHGRPMVTISGRNLPSLVIPAEGVHEIARGTCFFIGGGSVVREDVVSDMAWLTSAMSASMAPRHAEMLWGISEQSAVS